MNVSAFADYPFGTFPLGRYEEKMLEKNMDLPVFPHWIHRMWFKCKACHERLFIMERGSNDITMKKIDNGNLCGACHNGKMAFSPKNNCERCHQRNSSEKSMELVKFKDPKSVPFKEYRTIAEKLKIKWNAKAIEKDGLPMDKFDRIDFARLQLKDKLIIPRNYITHLENETIKENIIVFKTKSDFQPNVSFSHTIHTHLLDCQSCHPRLFTVVLGANKVLMKDMAKDGTFCAYCHTDIAFPLLDCLRCHFLTKDQEVDLEGEIIFRSPAY